MTRREWLLLSGAAGLVGCGKKEPAVRLVGESDEEAGNPERGFYVQRQAEDTGNLAALRSQGVSLVLLTLDLKHHRDRRLDEAKLSVLDEAMHRVRGAGVKVIFRAAYGFTDSDYRVDPADLDLIRGHIAAMGKVLASHSPWVFAVQAGMLGPWGEWHNSVHGDPPSREARLAVAKAWLGNLPEKIFLQVRRPMFLRDLDLDPTRCGFHNDALLAPPDDMGTYSEPSWERQKELDWCMAKLKGVPFGGETVPASESTAPAQVLTELTALHATFLNSGYHPGTLDHWRRSMVEGGSLFEKVRRRLGYRLSVKRIGPDRVILRSEGFSAPLNPRRVELGWFDPATRKLVGESVTETRDLRGWLPELGEIEVLLPPSNSERGGKLVPAMRLADDSEALAADGRHAIRLAGQGIRFEPESGWNLLG